MKPLSVWLGATAVAAPGLPDWVTAQAVLRGEADYRPQPLPTHAPVSLPANERRRATPAVRLAFRVAEPAVQGVDAGTLAGVFATADADIGLLHRISAALTETPRVVSPTDFHNSVHNTAAGYWSIAAAARGPMSTVTADDGSFGCGLLDAAMQVVAENTDALLVAYDIPPPDLLREQRPVTCEFAVAMRLHRAPPMPHAARLTLSLAAPNDAETPMAEPALEQLRLSNPAARSLPLLALLARSVAGRVRLPAGTTAVDVEVAPR